MEGVLHHVLFSAGLFFSLLAMILLVTSFPHYISYVTNLAEEFGIGGWVVPLGRWWGRTGR